MINYLPSTPRSLPSPSTNHNLTSLSLITKYNSLPIDSGGSGGACALLFLLYEYIHSKHSTPCGLMYRFLDLYIELMALVLSRSPKTCLHRKHQRGTSSGQMYAILCSSIWHYADLFLQGLRGLASVLVVTAHICRSLVPHLLSPAMSDKLPPTLFQLPFIRCLVMGRASVAAFALLAGYVNSLKPIKLSRAGNADAALSSVAKSSFRRTGRFMIPAIIATFCSWLVCQFGGYNIAYAADSGWIRDTSPAASDSFALAFYDLFKSLGTTWLDGFNAYDRIQWTLTYLLKGSMMTYLTLFATVYVKPKWRMFIVAGLYYFKWKVGDGTHMRTP